jgi:CheY-like chemotaxis protein
MHTPEAQMKFLVVDDDARFRRMMRTVLAGVAESVYECSDGSQAHASYAEHHPDWVLMDLMMPEVDGIEATRQITSSYPSARIVIVTSYESSAMREEARGAGACGYLLKENLLDLPQLLMVEGRTAKPGVECQPQLGF